MLSFGSLNKNNMYLGPDVELMRGDTTLRLDCFGSGGNECVGIRGSGSNSRNHVMQKDAVDDGCKLVLGLGPSPSIYCDEYYPGGTNKNKGFTALLNQGLSSEGDSILKLGLSGSGDEIFNAFECSAITQSSADTPHHLDQLSSGGSRRVIPVLDEGSTSAKKSGGYMPSLLLAPRIESRHLSFQNKELLELNGKSNFYVPELSSEPSCISDYSMDTISEPTTVAASSRKTINLKRCKFMGCSKGARGATGLCIGHGGGQRCQKPGCNKGAESRTAYCKAHGGGKRCMQLGCTKSAEGKTDYCIAHGGGRRCGFPGGCTRAARGRSGLCIRHGGGKRCTVEGCTRSAEGKVGLCISHGGGRRCQFPSCTKGAQGSTLYCKAHGGGKRCIFSGCTKGAEGSTPLCKAHGGGKRCLFDGGGICPKSVHGGTNFCVAHGGGKRCTVPGCTKSARGRTDCCVKHGGGKRCKFQNCGKSAQGSTDFCKAHGGGKRCCWGEGKCEKFARGKGGLCAAHSSLLHGRKETNKGSMIGPGLFHGLVPVKSNNLENTRSSSMASGSLEKAPERQQLIPPQVLVPLSMKASTYSSPVLSPEEQVDRNTNLGIGRSNTNNNLEFVVPEGRVHGGGLMSFLGGNLKNPIM